MGNPFRFAILLLIWSLGFVDAQVVDPAPQILSKSTVGQGDSFTVWCNYSSYRDIQLPVKDYVQWIGITRETEPPVVQIIAIYAPLSESKLYKKIPKDRDWDISYGGGYGKMNRNTIGINLTVNDASCEDAGKYMCWISLPDHDNLTYSTPAYLLRRYPLDVNDKTGCSNESDLFPIIDKKYIAPKESFTLKCDMSKFYNAHIPQDSQIESLAIVKQQESGDKEELAVYRPSNTPEKQLILNNPAGRQWSADASGQDKEMKVVLNVLDAQCTDAGTYMCSVLIANQNGVIYSSPFVLRAKVVSRNSVDKMTVSPPHTAVNETAKSFIGAHITVECTYKGFENLTSKWGSTRTASFLPNALILPADVIKDDQGCPIYLHKTTYSFAMDDNDNRATYYCIVFEAFNKVGMSSMRFFLERKLSDATKSKSRAVIFFSDAIMISVLAYILVQSFW